MAVVWAQRGLAACALVILMIACAAVPVPYKSDKGVQTDKKAISPEEQLENLKSTEVLDKETPAESLLGAETQNELSPDVVGLNTELNLLSPKEVQESVTEYDPSLDLTPRAIAEYLLLTGDFEGFDQALDDLLKAHIIQVNEATRYQEAVGSQYETLLRHLVDAKEAYLQMFLGATSSSSNTKQQPQQLPQQQQQTPPVVDPALQKESFSERKRKSDPPQAQRTLSLESVSKVDLGLALKKMQLRELLEREATLDELLRAVENDYLIKTLISDVKPEDILQDKKEQEVGHIIDLMSDMVDHNQNQEFPFRKFSAAPAPKIKVPVTTPAPSNNRAAGNGEHQSETE